MINSINLSLDGGHAQQIKTMIAWPESFVSLHGSHLKAHVFPRHELLQRCQSILHQHWKFSVLKNYSNLILKFLDPDFHKLFLQIFF